MKKIKSILFLEVFGQSLLQSDIIVQQQFRLFKITTFFAVVVLAAILYQVSLITIDHVWLLGIVGALFATVFINYFALAWHKKTKFAFFVLVALIFSVLHVISYGQGGIRNSGMFYLASIIFVAYLLLGTTGGKIMAALSLLHVVYFYLLSRYTNWTDYSLVGTSPGQIDMDFLLTGIPGILVVTAQVNYIEKSNNAIINDIRSKQEELAAKHIELLESQKALNAKNKELEQFAYVVSHDLQEPLRTTSSFTELLRQKYKGNLDEKADQYLTFITQSSERMKVMIKDLLDYSRIGRKAEREQVDCNEIVKQVIADLDTAVQEAKAIIKTTTLPVIEGYPTEMKLLFQNLIINAVKFRKKNTSPEIKISVQQRDNEWEFVVSDNGIGIEAEHKERIFIIFQRLHTRNQYRGSGIGLAHCKKIAELHGGKIWVESKPGEGSSFYFTIPKK